MIVWVNPETFMEALAHHGSATVYFSQDFAGVCEGNGRAVRRMCLANLINSTPPKRERRRKPRETR